MPRHLADYENDGFEKQLRECRCYTVEELFCCGYTRYFWEANKIRYPEYVGFAAIKTDYNNTDLSDTDLINLSGGKIRKKQKSVDAERRPRSQSRLPV